MAEKSSTQFGLKFWIILAAIIIVIAGLKAASDIVTPLFLALLITSVFYGPFLWLQKKGLPEFLALIVVLLGFTVISFLVIALLGASISGFASKVPFYEEIFTQYWVNINEWIVQMGLVESDSGLQKSIKPSSIMTIAGDVFTGFGNLMSNSFMVLLVVIFMLLETSVIIRKMKVIKPESLGKLDDVINNIKIYFSTKTITSLSTGICIFIALSIIGVDFPILWGFLAFLLNYVPNIGSTIAAIPAVLLALVQLGPGSAVITTVVYIGVNGLIGNLIEPRLMGKNLGLSPLVVLLALIFWGWVLGTVGMLLATPLTITLKIVFDSMDETKHLGLMLGTGSSIKQYEKEK